MRRIVFEGQTALGYRIIHEDDILEFSNAFEGDKCIAFYSTEFTESNKTIGHISFRMPNFGNYSSETDCHSYESGKLVTHIVPGPKEVKRSGFAKWISELDSRHETRSVKEA